MTAFSYTYHDWSDDELYPAASVRLRRLNKHIAEVAALLIPDSSGEDHSVNTVALQKYHASLLAARTALEAEVNARSGSPFQRVKRVRG